MKTNWNNTLITLGVSALAFAAAQNVQAQPAGYDRDANVRDLATPMSAQHFVWEAATTDMKEIHAGELALQKSDNADVKSFAKRLISDHKKSCKKLQSIAEKENLNFPDTNSMAMGGWQTNRWNSSWQTNRWNENGTNVNSEGQVVAGQDQHTVKGAELTEYKNLMETNDEELGGRPVMLEALSGEEFDRAFAAKMVKGHEKAIRKFEAAAANLPDEDLKKYAEKTLPTLREHLKMAQELQEKVGMWQDSGMTNSMTMPNQNQ